MKNFVTNNYKMYVQALFNHPLPMEMLDRRANDIPIEGGIYTVYIYGGSYYPHHSHERDERARRVVRSGVWENVNSGNV